MKKEKIRYKIDNFTDAVSRLKEAIELSRGNPLGIDALIKRFEFTFEMTWKCMRAVLEYEGVSCKTPRECFKKSYEYDYFDEEQIWLNILEDRNLISHIYDQKEAELLCEKIKDVYFIEFEKLRKAMEKRVKNGI